MSFSRFGRLWQWMTGPAADWTLLWLGLAMLTIVLLILTRTRWGQSRALEKCVFLSLLAHVLLAGLATTVQLVNFTAAVRDEPVSMHIVSWADDAEDQELEDPLDDVQQRVPKPWDKFVADSPLELTPVHLKRSSALETSRPKRIEPVIAASATEPSVPDLQRTPQHPAPDNSFKLPSNLSQRNKTVQQIETEPAERRSAAEPIVPQRASPRRAVATDNMAQDKRALASPLVARINTPTLRSSPLPQREPPTETAASETSASDTDTPSQRAKPLPPLAAERMAKAESPAAPSRPNFDHKAVRRPAGGALPKTYEMRVDPDRITRARNNGATAQTEAAVQAALKWLAANQSADGRWDADQLGAGRETHVAGHDRQGAGTQADTGITGLALLAFLGSGHTHLNGPYRDNVRRGLEFLLRSQDAQGNLAGEARLYARMYCHGMASFALSEGYAISGDKRLQPAVRDAIAYTAKSQHRLSGGWRYQPGDLGDMSQFGWQVMALHSADLAGVEFPQTTRRGAALFLRNSRSGRHGGKAAYKVGHATSRVMTAEALVCRQFLELNDDKQIFVEAGNYILEDLPSAKHADLYYWYYATIGMFQLQGEYWRRWNEALRPALIERQRQSGDLAGSWDPDTRWGSYGGRAYSTAMAALCLEVYYRYLPKTARHLPKTAP